MTDNAMVDLETWGQTPGCAIVSIGAVMFDKTVHLDKTFYVVVNRQSCLDAGLFEEVGTIDWWMRQSEEARSVLAKTASKTDSLSLKDALSAFNDWLRQHGNPGSVCVWGNGSDFDNALLACAYRAVGMRAAWMFWNSRCFRTTKNRSTVQAPKRQGVHHNALDDAIHQAQWQVLIDGGTL